MALTIMRNNNLINGSKDSVVVLKNIVISAALAVTSIVLIFIGLTLTPLSKAVIDGTSASYLIDNNIGLFVNYIKILISGGYYLVAPMWVTTSIFVIGVSILYLSSFYLIKRAVRRPYRILISKSYWSSFTLKVG